MKDSWNLRELFQFNEKKIRLYNDTSHYVDGEINGIKTQIRPGGLIERKIEEDSYLVTDHAKYNWSDLTIKYEDPEYTLSIVIQHLLEPFENGQVKDGLQLLEFHYNKTDRKQDFLLFVKYYFVSSPSPSPFVKKAIGFHSWIVDDWIKTKKQNEKKYQLFLIKIETILTKWLPILIAAAALIVGILK